MIQPMPESHGESTVSVAVIDERGNEWRDSFKVDVSEIEDPPESRDYRCPCMWKSERLLS